MYESCLLARFTDSLYIMSKNSKRETKKEICQNWKWLWRSMQNGSESDMHREISVWLRWKITTAYKNMGENEGEGNKIKRLHVLECDRRIGPLHSWMCYSAISGVSDTLKMRLGLTCALKGMGQLLQSIDTGRWPFRPRQAPLWSFGRWGWTVDQPVAPLY